MAKVNEGVLRNWNNGETVDEASYERDFEILRVAGNDTHDRTVSNANGLKALEDRTEVLESDNETNKESISVLDSRTTNMYTKSEVNTQFSLTNGVFVDGGSFLDTYGSEDGNIDGGEW